MKEKQTSTVLTNKLVQLNDLEIQKSKILVTIFQKTTQEIINKKMQALKNDFQEQARFYGQKLEDYEESYQKIREKYQEQLIQIVKQYHELVMNLYLELQEIQCNQMIAITNLKKSYDKKQEILDSGKIDKIKEYDRKMKACLQKKNNYDKLVKECEKELDEYQKQIEKKINALFKDRVAQLFLREESLIKKIIHKIKNKISGKMKFNTYVLEPLNVEIEMRDSKLPDILAQIEQETILFVAKMKQAKAETNQIFESMIEKGEI